MTDKVDTTTEATPATKPSVDVSTVKPDASGNVNITKAAQEVRAERRGQASPEVKPAAQDGEKPAEKPSGDVVAAPVPKTFTQEEYDQGITSIKAGHKGTVDKMRTDLSTAMSQVETLKAEAEEKATAKWLQGIEDGGADRATIDAAKTIAERGKAVAKAEREAKQKTVELTEKETLLNIAGRGKLAHELVTTHGLGKEVVEELLKSEDPKEMEIKALTLALDKGKATALPAEKPDKGVASTKGVDVTKIPATQRLGMIMEGEL